jgi:hypothetical protein
MHSEPAGAGFSDVADCAFAVSISDNKMILSPTCAATLFITFPFNIHSF